MSEHSSKKMIRIDDQRCGRMCGWFSDIDLPINVLSRLPTKTLNGLRLVSKEWDRLISDRCFIRAHNKRKGHESITGFFFQARYQWSDSVDINTVSYIPVGTKNAKVHSTVLQCIPESVVVVSSSNGLICCRSCLPCAQPKIYVCNPLTREFVSLQFPSTDTGRSIALAFDPIRDPVDVSTNFEVVRVYQTETENEESLFSFDVYSSKTGSWRRLPEICKCSHNLFKSKGIYVEGKLYWLTDGNQIIMLDLTDELSLLIMEPLPLSELDYIPEMCLGESNGKLHYGLVTEYGLQSWVLLDPYESRWELEHSIGLDKLEEENPELVYNIVQKVKSRVSFDKLQWIDVLAFKDGFLLMRVVGDILLYHFKEGKLRKLTDLVLLGPSTINSPIVLPYAMSLVPLDRE